jgi:hypothetical protein
MKSLVSLMVLGGVLTVAPPATAQEVGAMQTIEVQDRRDRGERWRYRQHNGRWWYWTPSETWVYWDGGRWIPYGSYARSAPRYYSRNYDNVPGRRYYATPDWRYGNRYDYRYGSRYGAPYYRDGFRAYGPGVYIGRGAVGIRF